MDKKQIVYKLSATWTTEEHIAEACGYRFQRITPSYILVYGETIPKCAHELSAEHLANLTHADRVWLSDCNNILMQEFEKEHAESKAKAQADFIAELKENIKREMEQAE